MGIIEAPRRVRWASKGDASGAGSKVSAAGWSNMKWAVGSGGRIEGLVEVPGVRRAE